MKSPLYTPREVNKRLLLQVHQDGLLDMLSGLIIITFGLIPILDNYGLSPGLRQVVLLSVYSLNLLGFLLLKQWITLPRSGMVVLKASIKSRITLALLLANTSLFIFFLLAYLLEWQLWEILGDHVLSIPLGLIFMLMLSLGAILLKAIRYFLFGLLVMAGFVLCESLFIAQLVPHHGIPHAAFISGGLIFLCGLILLRRFILTYPRPRD